MIIRFLDGDTLDFLNEFSVEHEHHGMNLPEVGDIVSLKTKEAEIAESNSDEIYLKEAYIHYDITPPNKEIRENIDKYIEWVDKISSIANDMKVASERMKSNHDISYHFYNNVSGSDNSISITISLSDDDIIKKQNNGHIDYLLINLPKLRSEFNIPIDISIKTEWWNNIKSNAYSLNFSKKRMDKYDVNDKYINNDLIEFLSKHSDYVSHHFTKAKTLVVRFKAKHIILVGK